MCDDAVKYVFYIILKSRSFSKFPNTVLPIDWELETALKAKVVSGTMVDSGFNLIEALSRACGIISDFLRVSVQRVVKEYEDGRIIFGAQDI